MEQNAIRAVRIGEEPEAVNRDSGKQRAIGMLYSLIIRFPDLDDMLRPVIRELEG